VVLAHEKHVGRRDGSSHAVLAAGQVDDDVLERADLGPELGPRHVDEDAARLALRRRARLEGRGDGRPLGGRLVRAVDAQHVGPRADHVGGPFLRDLRGVGSRHHDVDVALGRVQPEQCGRVRVQERLGARTVERIRLGALLPGEPPEQAPHGVPHVPFRAAERREAGLREIQLQAADVPLAEAQVVREVPRAEPVLGQRGLHARAVPGFLGIDQVVDGLHLLEQRLGLAGFHGLPPPHEGS